MVLEEAYNIIKSFEKGISFTQNENEPSYIIRSDFNTQNMTWVKVYDFHLIVKNKLHHRNCDGIIYQDIDGEFKINTVSNNNQTFHRTAYNSYDEAFAALMLKFKKKKLIGKSELPIVYCNETGYNMQDYMLAVRTIRTHEVQLNQVDE